MKRISKGCYAAAGALFLWAAVDGFHYASVGRSIVSYYAGSGIIQQLVHNSLFQGIGKALLGCLVLLLGWRRGKKETPVSSLAAVTGLLTVAVLGVWGVSMYCVTAVAAEYAAARYLSEYEMFASTLTQRNLEPWLGKGDHLTYENYDANRMWEAVDDGGRAGFVHTYSGSAEGESGFLSRPDCDKIYSAAAIYDPAGNLLVSSWEDYIYFEYLTEEQWANREERSGNNVRALFDRTKLTETGLEMVQDSSLVMDVQALRMTGTLDGAVFTPKTIEGIGREDFEEALFSKGSGTYTISGVVRDFDLAWISLYENPEAVEPDTELVTVYSDWFDVCYHRPSPGFSYGGSRYEGLDTLVAKLGPDLSGGIQNMVRYEGLDLIIPSVNYCFTIEGKTYYSPYFYGGEEYEVQFYTVSAVYCSPWRTAWGELRNVYLLTLLPAVGLILFVRAAVRRRLIEPVRQVGEALEREADGSGGRPETFRAWREGQVLQAGFRQCSGRMHLQKNEIARLNTALEYAKKAEENRRQMTSNIAHELKTPLAVIHSYAEGLKEHAAEEKRDKYIDVILAEAERTDGMVMEMLDLSRLEAGKVKLSRDDFSLIALTRSVFEKLEMAVEEKNLQVEFSFPEDFTVTADESRIAQVIENFATNAVKYTPAGGHVAVQIKHDGEKTSFIMENESAPLSSEALSKVWDTFYRADESRSGGGTGLGLAIAKSIIELHGGRCAVRNTVSGVEFRFTI